MPKISDKNKKLIKEMSFVVLRVSIGVLFVYSGVSKVIDGFTAEGYLTNSAYGPFKDIFVSMAGSPIVDFLVIWGEIGIGLSMVFGILTRFGASMGMLMMFLFYLSNLWPERGPFNNQFMYGIVFLYIFVNGANYFSIDKLIKDKLKIPKILKYLLG